MASSFMLKDLKSYKFFDEQNLRFLQWVAQYTTWKICKAAMQPARVQSSMRKFRKSRLLVQMWLAHHQTCYCKGRWSMKAPSQCELLQWCTQVMRLSGERYKTTAVQRYQQRKLRAALIRGAENQKVGHSFNDYRPTPLQHVCTLIILVKINNT